MTASRSRRTPDRGDVVWLDFQPQAGHEQAGRRPALVLSPRDYNRKTGLAIFCPITNQIKGFPFEVTVRGTRKVAGVVLADQVKSLDWRVRNAEVFDHVDHDVVEDVQARVAALMGLDD